MNLKTYASVRRAAPPIMIVLQLLCGAMVLLSGDAAIPWLTYCAAGAGVVAMVMVWLTKSPNLRVDGVLFLAAALAGGMVLGGWQTGFPTNLPAWLWCVAAVLLAAIAIVIDADTKQSRARNRF
ncbi:MAG: hypothetical protein ACQEXN_17900 [Actinomycetota bacterium]